jgi:hypothetical protein
MTSALPGTKPSRPSYPPPIPTSDLPDQGGATPQIAAHRTQLAVKADYERWRAAHSPDISPDILKSNSGAYAVSNPALQLQGVLDAAKQDSEDANRKANDLIKGTRVGDDVASQLAAQRYWARAQRTFDAQSSGSKAVAAARNLIDSASGAEIPVLAEELSSYLASRSLPTDWLAGALAAGIPGLSDATAEAAVKAKQHAILQRNHQALTDAFQKDVPAPQLLSPDIATSTPYSDGYTGG